MISYSRNLEDVVLERVFGDVGSGTYVDVGAGHPVWDSNTYSLYRRGWRGVVVEPLLRFKPYREDWEKFRPHDERYNKLVGAGEGTRELHIFESLQLSTGCKEVVDGWRRSGKSAARKETVDVVRLDSIMPPGSVHFLSIDVEGMESEVITGLGPRLPWVVCLETTRPGTNQMHDPSIVDRLTARGYSLVYFDGVNAFLLDTMNHRYLRNRFRLDAPGGYTKFSDGEESCKMYSEWQDRTRCEAAELFT